MAWKMGPPVFPCGCDWFFITRVLLGIVRVSLHRAKSYKIIGLLFKNQVFALQYSQANVSLSSSFFLQKICTKIDNFGSSSCLWNPVVFMPSFLGLKMLPGTPPKLQTPLSRTVAAASSHPRPGKAPAPASPDLLRRPSELFFQCP